jgi:hypothetical protein
MKKNRLDYSQIIFAIIFFNLIIAIFLIIAFFIFLINMIFWTMNLIEGISHRINKKSNTQIEKTKISELN